MKKMEKNKKLKKIHIKKHKNTIKNKKIKKKKFNKILRIKLTKYNTF